MNKSPLQMLGIKPKSPLNDTGDPIEENNAKSRIEGLRMVLPKVHISGTKRKEEGYRTDYIPKRQNIVSESNPDLTLSKQIYNRGKEMVSDSLGLVNIGEGVKATQMYGPNLGEDLRSSTGAGNFESKVAKIDKNIMYPAHTKAARQHARRQWAEGEDIATGKKHYDWSSYTSISDPVNLEKERNRRKKL
jgi:hypothetical protein